MGNGLTINRTRAEVQANAKKYNWGKTVTT